VSKKGSPKGRSPFGINSSLSPFQGVGDKGGEVFRPPHMLRIDERFLLFGYLPITKDFRMDLNRIVWGASLGFIFLWL
jgi:hypothetical protein